MSQASNKAFKRFKVFNQIDNVALALADLSKGEMLFVEGRELVLNQPIEFGHKFAIKHIPKGENIIKHGEIIGIATSDIPAALHVHTHNIESLRARRL